MHVHNYVDVVHIISWRMLNVLIILNQNEQFEEIYKKVTHSVSNTIFAGRSALHVPKLSFQTFIQYCQCSNHIQLLYNSDLPLATHTTLSEKYYDN